MKNLKKTMSLLMALAIVFAMLPVMTLTASAVTADYTLFFKNGDEGWGLYHGNSAATGAVDANILYPRVNYSAAANTLTLNGFDFTTSASQGLNFTASTATLTLTLEGTNTITSTNAGLTNYGIFSTNLTITGTGTLTASASGKVGHGIYASTSLAINGGTVIGKGSFIGLSAPTLSSPYWWRVNTASATPPSPPNDDFTAHSDTPYSHANTQKYIEITFTDPASNIATAKGLIENNAPTSVAQATANTEAAVKTWLAAQLNAITGMGATGITITEGDITISGFNAATAGTVGDLDGENGSFSFVVEVKKGTGTSVNTTSKSVTITATPYDATGDNNAISAAKDLIENNAPSIVAQATVNTDAAAKTWLVTHLNAIPGMSATGITITEADITISNFNAATAGTVGTPNGVNGSFSFVVEVKKGAGTTVNTASKSVTITATVYSTPVNASISPTTANFNLDTSYADYKDIAVTLMPGSYTLTAIKNGEATLAAGSDYTVNGDTVTLTKKYLATLDVGIHTFTFFMSGGTNPTLTVTITDGFGVPPTGIPSRTGALAAALALIIISAALWVYVLRGRLNYGNKAQDR